MTARRGEKQGRREPAGQLVCQTFHGERLSGSVARGHERRTQCRRHSGCCQINRGRREERRAIVGMLSGFGRDCADCEDGRGRRPPPVPSPAHHTAARLLTDHRLARIAGKRRFVCPFATEARICWSEERMASVGWGRKATQGSPTLLAGPWFLPPKSPWNDDLSGLSRLRPRLPLPPRLLPWPGSFARTTLKVVGFGAHGCPRRKKGRESGLACTPRAHRPPEALAESPPDVRCAISSVPNQSSSRLMAFPGFDSGPHGRSHPAPPYCGSPALLTTATKRVT